MSDLDAARRKIIKALQLMKPVKTVAQALELAGNPYMFLAHHELAIIDEALTAAAAVVYPGGLAQEEREEE